MISDTVVDTNTADAAAYGHLRIDQDGRVTYVGYSLPVSPLETNLLRRLILHAQEAPGCYLSGASLAESLGRPPAESVPGMRPPRACMTVGQLSVHIGRINRKARMIGGRDLILCKRYRGYRLNLYM